MLVVSRVFYFLEETGLLQTDLHWNLDLNAVSVIVCIGLKIKSRPSKRKESGPHERFLFDEDV